ncbi:MAG: hypothetical protein LH614_16520 [Pyrinomonadaceae bacterium]|nr:hypothetical protein [Pyrinomonadaceae bacterium]
MPIVFLTFGLICIGMFLPFLIFPMVSGTDWQGYYVFHNKRGGVARFSPFAVLMLNVVNTVLIITFFSLATYFKGKFEEKKQKSAELQVDIKKGCLEILKPSGVTNSIEITN